MIDIIRTFWFGKTIPEDVLADIETSRATAKAAGIRFELHHDDTFVEEPSEHPGRQSAVAKNSMAIDYATKEPGLLVIDADIALLSMPELPDDNTPYFSNSICFPCICMFAVNGNTKFFESYVTDCEERGIKWRTTYGAPQKWLRPYGERNEVGVIPPECYIHKARMNGGESKNERRKNETYVAIESRYQTGAVARAEVAAATAETEFRGGRGSAVDRGALS